MITKIGSNKTTRSERGEDVRCVDGNGCDKKKWQKITRFNLTLTVT